MSKNDYKGGLYAQGENLRATFENGKYRADKGYAVLTG